MTFDNLKVAMHLNESEQPSLTMAFYMIQNLIKDMETEAGMKFKDIDMGNTDEFPILLAGQCRMIKSVYKSSADTLTRNRDRLEKLDGELTDIQKTLDEDADIGEQIIAKEKERQNLQQQWEKLLQDKQEYEQIDKECKRLESDIRKMENIDIRQRKKEAEELNKQYQSYGKKQRELTEKISSLEREIEKLKVDNAGLINTLTEKHQSYKELESKKQKYGDTLSQLDRILPELTKDVENKQNILYARTAEKDNLEKRKETLERQITVRTEEYNRFYHEHIEPMEQGSEALERKIVAQEQEKQKLLNHYQQLQNDYKKNLADIEVLPDSIRKLQSDISTMNSQYEELISQNRKLNNGYQKLSQDIIRKQNENLTLSMEKIPELQGRLKQIEADKKENQWQLDKINKDIENVQRDTQLLARKIEESHTVQIQKERELSELRTKYDINSEEIAKLEKQLQELKGGTNKEKVEMRRNQLEEEVAKFKKLQRECDELTEKCRTTKRDIQAEQERKETLSKSKEDYENQLEKYRYATRQLQQYQTKEFQIKFRTVKDKVDLTYDIKNRMEHASEKLSKIASREKFQMGREWESIFTCMQIINEYVTYVQNNILEETKKFFDSENHYGYCH